MIRAIQKKDVKEVLPLIEWMYNNHQEEVPYFMEPLESVDILEDRLYKMMKLKGFYQFVYELNKKIIGYMDISIHEEHMDLLFPSEQSIILDTLVLYPEYRGQNFAGEMIYFACEHAKNLGFNSMQIHALTAFPKLTQYYQKFGFKNISTYMTYDLKGENSV